MAPLGLPSTHVLGPMGPALVWEVSEAVGVLACGAPSPTPGGDGRAGVEDTLPWGMEEPRLGPGQGLTWAPPPHAASVGAC